MANPPPKSLQPFVDKDMQVVQIPVKYSEKLDRSNWVLELFENGIGQQFLADDLKSCLQLEY